MPIKGVSDLVRLPRLGKIRLGIRRETTFATTLIEATSYFVCPEEVKKALGEDKPKELQIMFPTEDQGQWASQYLRRYSDSFDLLCRGDGRRAVKYIGPRGSGRDREPARLKEITCDRLTCRHYLDRECRKVMNLQFLLPDCPGFGVYQLDTGCIYSIRNINAAVALTRAIAPRVSMIPLRLELVEQETRIDGLLQTIYVLRLAWTKSLFELQKFAQVNPCRALLVPAPDSEAPCDIDAGSPGPAVPARDDDSERVETRLELWTKARSLISEYEIQPEQLVRWFREQYHLSMAHGDFDSEDPPDKLDSTKLSFFCSYVISECSPR